MLTGSTANLPQLFSPESTSSDSNNPLDATSSDSEMTKAIIKAEKIAGKRRVATKCQKNWSRKIQSQYVLTPVPHAISSQEFVAPLVIPGSSQSSDHSILTLSHESMGCDASHTTDKDRHEESTGNCSIGGYIQYNNYVAFDTDYL